MNYKRILVKLHWISAMQFGSDPRKFFKSVYSLPRYFRIFAYISVFELGGLFFTWVLFRITDRTLKKFESYDGYSYSALI